MFYKIIVNNEIVGAVSEKDFMRYQSKHNIILSCDRDSVQYVLFDGVLYRDEWMFQLIDNNYQYIPAEVVYIDELEYNAIIEAFENGEEIPHVEQEEPQQIYVPTPDITVNFVCENKINNMSDMCNKTILDGCDVVLSDGQSYHFTFQIVDQIKISKLYELAKAGNAFLPYHADDGEEKIFSSEDICTLKRAMEYHIEYNIAYFNSLKGYINSLDTIETISAVQYGDEIPDEFHSAVLDFLIDNPHVMDAMYII